MCARSLSVRRAQRLAPCQPAVPAWRTGKRAVADALAAPAVFFDDYDLDALHMVGVVGQTMDPAALRQPTTTVLAAVGVRR